MEPNYEIIKFHADWTEIQFLAAESNELDYSAYYACQYAHACGYVD